MNDKLQSITGKALKAKHFFIAGILFLSFSFGAAKLQAQKILENSSNSSLSDLKGDVSKEEASGKARNKNRGLSGTWKGTYICGQGLTNLTLKITKKTSSNLRAVFNFSANQKNPEVPSGSYRMRGTYNNRTRKLFLKATKWINHPENYLTVDLAGYVWRSKNRMSGKVLNSACTTFRLVRK